MEVAPIDVATVNLVLWDEASATVGPTESTLRSRSKTARQFTPVCFALPISLWSRQTRFIRFLL